MKSLALLKSAGLGNLFATYISIFEHPRFKIKNFRHAVFTKILI